MQFKVPYPVITTGWVIQVRPLQNLRRWALTRCAWCGGRSVKGDRVNHSAGWDRPAGPWWRGERGLYHRDCLTVEHAHRTCTCGQPLLAQPRYGKCGRCGRFRPYNAGVSYADRLLQQLPRGSRIPADLRPQLEAAWADARAAREKSTT